MEAKQDELYLEDTAQTKRMKELALNFAYSNIGEMYRLLSTEAGHKAVKNIKEGKVKLSGKLKYGKDEITLEEKFLENLDNYITYVKDNYFVNSIEQFILIELSLNNKYSAILYSDIDFYNDFNYQIYHNEYRKMFFYNLFENIKFFANLYKESDYLHSFFLELKDLNYNDNNDIIKIEKLLKKVIISRNNNLFNAFTYYKDVKKRDYSFYFYQVEWVISEYYRRYVPEQFEVTETDHIIEVEYDSKILFNIISQKKDIYLIEFGINNHNFSCKSNFELRKKELEQLIMRLNKNKSNEQYDEYMTFVSPVLKFNFWSDNGSEQFLDIKYEFGNGTDYYSISIDSEDIKQLHNLIKEQL